MARLVTGLPPVFFIVKKVVTKFIAGNNWKDLSPVAWRRVKIVENERRNNS